MGALCVNKRGINFCKTQPIAACRRSGLICVLGGSAAGRAVWERRGRHGFQRSARTCSLQKVYYVLVSLTWRPASPQQQAIRGRTKVWRQGRNRPNTPTPSDRKFPFPEYQFGFIHSGWLSVVEIASSKTYCSPVHIAYISAATLILMQH